MESCYGERRQILCVRRLKCLIPPAPLLFVRLTNDWSLAGQLLSTRDRELRGVDGDVPTLGSYLRCELDYIRSRQDSTFLACAFEVFTRLRLIRRTTLQWAKAQREQISRVLLASLPQAELQMRLHEEQLIEKLPCLWQRVLYRAFLSMDELPTMNETGRLRYLMSGSATLLCGGFMLWATLYILAFHLRQVSETDVMHNMDVYLEFLLDIGVVRDFMFLPYQVNESFSRVIVVAFQKLVLITPIYLLARFSLCPRFVEQVLNQPLEACENELRDGRDDIQSSVITLRIVMRLQRRFRRRLQTMEDSPSHSHGGSINPLVIASDEEVGYPPDPPDVASDAVAGGESSYMADENGTPPVHSHITDWVEADDPESGTTFYYNTATGESRWEPPDTASDTPIVSSQAGEDPPSGEVETDSTDTTGHQLTDGDMDIELCDVFNDDVTIDACDGPNASEEYSLGSANPMRQAV